MSVINQMLKDLDNRQAKSPELNLSKPVTATERRFLMPLLFVVIALLLATVIYLLLQAKTNEPALTNDKNLALTKASSAVPANADIPEDIAITADVEQKKVQSQRTDLSIEQSVTSNNTTDSVAHQVAPDHSEVTVASVIEHAPEVIETSTVTSPASVEKQSIPASGLAEQATDIATRLEKTQALSNESSQVPEQVNLTTEPASGKMTIIRRDITEAELISKNLQAASVALENNKPKVAEKAYQDILMLDIKHVEAREQLAALWYGRNQMQQAMNLLAQGLAIQPDYWPFRLMQAKILLSQQEPESAFQMLNFPMSNPSAEALIMLASLAQQTQHFDVASKTYKQLAERFPSQSRWWLGIAIAFDSATDYSQARAAYRHALSLPDLSIDSQQFIVSRLQALGE